MADPAIDHGVAEVFTICDNGHRVYVFQSGQRGGITVIDDPTCPGSAR